MAGRNIKGITIEIGGDTTKLTKALSNVDKSLRTTQQKLKDVNRLLKFNPGNTELLRQKQKALADSITQTKDRLKQLKEAQKQAEQQLKEGKIGQEEYDALQREIIETESKLKNLQKQYKEFGSVAKQKLKEVGDSMKEFGGKVTEVGENITKNVTGPILALGGASLAAFKSVDSGYDEMIKKTGATGDAAKELQGILENVATNVPTDFDTAGKAIGEVATRFDVAGQDLEYLSEKFIKFAELNNTDVVQSVDSVQKAMAAYGLGVEDADSYLDRLNKTAQETGVDVTKLADNVATNAAQFKELGLGIEESTVFMGKLDKSGLDSSQVMTGLRKALKKATDSGKPLNEALSDLQDTLLNTEDDTEALSEAYDLFGTKSAPAIADAVKDGRINFEDLAGAISDAGGSIEDTFAEIDDPIRDLKTKFNELKVVGAKVAEPLLSMLAPAIEKLGQFISDLKDKWDSLSPAQQEAIEKALLVAAAVGPILVIVGNIITVIGGLVSAIGLLFSPIGIVIAVIGALIAIGILLYKNWDTIKEKAVEIWTKIKDFIFKAIQYIKKSIEDHIKRVYTFWVNIWERVKSFFIGIWQSIKTNAASFVGGVRDAIKTVVNNIYTNWVNVWNRVRDFFSRLWENIKTYATTGIQGVYDTVKNKVSSIYTTWVQIWDRVKSAVSGVWDSIKTTISDKIAAAEEVISGFVDRVREKINGIMERIGLANNAAATAGTGKRHATTPISRPYSISSISAVDNDLIATNPTTNSILTLLENYLPYLAEQQDIYIDGDKLVGATAPAINKTLGMIQIRERRR